jgi:hypothetical protein
VRFFALLRMTSATAYHLPPSTCGRPLLIAQAPRLATSTLPMEPPPVIGKDLALLKSCRIAWTRRLSEPEASSRFCWNKKVAGGAASTLLCRAFQQCQKKGSLSHLGFGSASRFFASCARGSCRPAARARSSVSRPFASCLVCSCAMPR